MVSSTASQQTRPKCDEIALETNNLRKSYGKKEVLHGVDLLLKPGEMFGLIGPDGAGKTTIMQIVSGVMPFNSGTVKVMGKDPHQARRKIGYVTQQFSLYPDLSIDENMRYVGGIHDVPDRELRERKTLFLNKLGLSKFSERLASQLSGGMKQKLALCCALIASPELLLLDEPTVGVDPLSRLEFWELLNEFKSDAFSILVATPYYEEADRCDRVALLSDGVIALCDAPEKLKDNLHLQRFEVYTDDNRQAQKIIQDSIPGKTKIVDVYTFGDHLDVLIEPSRGAEDSIRDLLAQQHILLKELKPGKPTIENVFLLQAMKQGEHKAQEPTEFNDVWKRSGSAKKGAAICAQQLVKRFGKFEAVKNLNLEIQYGEIYGLLGANGAGKTTTIKMLCGLLDASSGKMQLGGETNNLRSSALRKRIGYMSQKSTLYTDLTVKENLELYSAAYEIPIADRKRMIDWALASCILKDRADQRIADLPKGLIQRAAFAAAVMHSPDILFLDEPSSGVDPVARRQIWHMIRGLAESGAAILVTTHSLDEAEYCNRLGIMAGGELLVEGTSLSLREAEKSDTLEAAFIKLVERRRR